MQISLAIIDKYKNKPLVVPEYASRKKEYYSIDDFKDFEWLMHYLGEVNSHEAYITNFGIEFFKEVYGLENLAQLLYNNQWFKEEFSSTKEIFEWLQWWEKEVKN